MKPFITTFTGREVNPLDLKEEDISLEDIAHALACTNRFNGHLRFPISVAQHSVWVSKLSGPFGLEGLLHDASEAYLGDMTKWLKESEVMAGYQVIEERAQKVIYNFFHIYPDRAGGMPGVVDWADKLTVRFEHEVGFGYASHVLGYGPLTKPERAHFNSWQPLSWQDAETAFLLQFLDLKR